jgi:hypothetical protein
MKTLVGQFFSHAIPALPAFNHYDVTLGQQIFIKVLTGFPASEIRVIFVTIGIVTRDLLASEDTPSWLCLLSTGFYRFAGP